MSEDRHWQPTLRHWKMFWWDCKLCKWKGIYVHGLHAPLSPHNLPSSHVSSLWRIAPGHRCWGFDFYYYEHIKWPWVPYLDNDLQRWRYTWKQIVYHFTISWNGFTITCFFYPANISLTTSTMAYRGNWKNFRNYRFGVADMPKAVDLIYKAFAEVTKDKIWY